MLCHIYRSNRKLDTYLYLVDKDDFSIIPEDLLRIFGSPEFSVSNEKLGISYFYPGLMVIKTIVCLDLTCE